MKKAEYNYFMVFDLDNTLIDSARTIMNLYNTKYGTNHKVDFKDLDWDFKPYITNKEDLQKALDLFSDSDFYNPKYLVLFDNIINIINELTNCGYKIAICTKHESERKKNTIEWAKKVMPKVTIIFADDFHKKAEVVGRCKIFFDDRIDALNGMKDNADFLVCVGDYNWNKNWDGCLRQNPHEWKDLNNFIKKLLTTK